MARSRLAFKFHSLDRRTGSWVIGQELLLIEVESMQSSPQFALRVASCVSCLLSVMVLPRSGIAGDVSVLVKKGNAVIVGSASDDVFSVDMQGTPEHVNVTPGAGTTVNGMAVAVAFPGVSKSIVVDAGAGADTVTLQSITVSRNVTLRGRDGADSLSLTASAIGRDFVCDGGAGNDTLSLSASSIGRRARWLGGNDSDSVSVSAAGFGRGVTIDFGGVGAGFESAVVASCGSGVGRLFVRGSGASDGISLTNTGWRSVRLAMGAGNNVVTTSNNEFGSTLRIDGGDGTDSVGLVNSAAAKRNVVRLGDGSNGFVCDSGNDMGRLTVFGGVGSDGISVLQTTSTVGDMTLNAKGGDNAMLVSGSSIARNLRVLSGDGSDSITLMTNTVGKKTIVKHGAGNDAIN